MNIFEDAIAGIANAMVPAVEKILVAQEKLAKKVDEWCPESKIVEGASPRGRNAACEYAIDTETCANWGYKCAGISQRKPPCQKACERSAVIWTGVHMEIDQMRCKNCGKCGEACLHYAVLHDGVPVGMTWGKAGRLVLKGTIRGITGGWC